MEREELPDLEEGPPRRVLAICGGGYAGLFAAEFLARLEGDLADTLGDDPLGHAFDLIAGTSIGGILALGLAGGIRAAELPPLLADLGPVLFGQPGLGFLRAKHDPKPLSDKLAKVFGDALLSSLPRPVLVPAINLTGGETLVFGNGRHDPTARCRVHEAAMATSAAPWYLPAHGADHRLYADGGLVANSPETLAAVEAVHGRGWPRDRVRMLVVGSTRIDARLSGDLLEANWGLASWGNEKRLLTTTMCAQMSLARQLSRRVLGEGNIVEVDVELTATEQKLIGLDKADRKATLALRTLAKEAHESFLADHPLILENWFGATEGA